MIGKDSLTHHKCSSVNYGIASFEVLYEGQVDYLFTCHHNFMDLKYWLYFKVKYMLNLVMICYFICLGW